MSAQDPVQIGVGCRIEIELIDNQGREEPMEVILVPENAADLTRGFLSVASPLGKALRGRFEGDEVEYSMGDVRAVRILTVEPTQAEIESDAAQRRQEVLDEARRKAEKTNADMFASSFSGKWGDYNTDDIKTDDIKTDDIKTDDIKTDDIKTDNIDVDDKPDDRK